MKIKNIIVAVLVSAVLPFFTSCNNQQYPSHLEGVWAYVNASTGYTGILVIEDIEGGQYAYFSLVTPTQEQESMASGSFTYDSATGKGTISSGLVGGTTSVVAYLSTDSKVDVVVTALVSGGVQTTFEGTFEKKSTIDISTGTWTGTHTEASVVYNLTMSITSIQPKSGSCGTLAIKKGTETKTATITEISSFVKIEDDTALGIMVMREDGTSLDMPFAVTYDPLTKDVTLTDVFSGDFSVELKAVDLD